MIRWTNPSFFKDLRACLAFITILPTGKNPVYSPLGMIRFFPVVGLIIGALLVITDVLASMVWPAPAAALVDLIFLVAVTGAFHLDGLGDTADGMFSHRGREQALEIMKDSRTGMMGLVAVVLGLATKLAGIWSVKINCSPVQAMAIFFLVPAFSRAAMIFGIKYLRYGRKGGGTGKDLFDRRLNSKDFYLCLIPLGLSLFLGSKGLILIFGFALGCVAVLKFYERKMNCITGDMLGAMTEVMEAWLFMVAGMNIF
ncbi:adenosylcobinamide-GDP ribazoletransferase [Desulfobacter hydrogenophilus]|uniref:Adenosylcobinamide-GDP ribazoletransferase n=1 Tax=Desulfobacter hydrogenophilus TaxID=2291 RepID=A0A328FJC5_9BACT|nr:adenosylcobinamide-GDP ribazoletransferase [Desulfobacter hydrogenophilus]NDY72710.1 adenosylcobinamide-GDP ribazoletransferase [Desulfobacter hydrogenophilus]QBH12547.1 adenosylcobinamide-GDP ribazoletransferase [Desulfobacter hydrogenophilus]RAM03283.1 adenosylcobinamide-GDP ribazoletransferase [Desulfobacter hydrogenophilus]